MTDPPTVALLGIGTMGAGMARNIAAAGLPLRVWNRSRDKAEPLADVGAVVAATPAEAVDGADIVITMVFDEASVAETMAAARAGVGSRHALAPANDGRRRRRRPACGPGHRARPGLPRRSGAGHPQTR